MKKETRWIISNTHAATAGDVRVTDQYLYWKGERLFRLLDVDGLESDAKNVGIAEVPNAGTAAVGATVINSTAAAPQDYTIKVTQYNPNTNKTKTISITHRTPVLGTVSGTTVVAAWKAWVDAQTGLGFTAGASTNTLTLTGVAGYGPLTIYVVSQPTAITVVNNTVAYVAEKGGYVTPSSPPALVAVGQQLAAMGCPLESLVSGAHYTVITVKAHHLMSEGNTLAQKQGQIFNFVLQNLDAAGGATTNYSTLMTRMNEILHAFAASGSTVDPEWIQIES